MLNQDKHDQIKDFKNASLRSQGRNEAPSAPPLKIWFMLLCITFVLLTLLLTFGKKAVQNPKEAYIQQRLAHRNGRPVILFLGTSLTQCALDSSNKMETLIEKATGKRPIILKIWQQAIRLSCTIKGVLSLEKIHPTLVVIEANALAYPPFPEGIWQLIPRIMSSLIKSTPYSSEEKPREKVKFVGNKVFKKLVFDTTELAFCRDFSARLWKSGTRVILLNFPALRTKNEPRGWSEARSELIKRELQYFDKKVPYKYLNPSKSWDSSYYLDIIHMNRKGSIAYSKWLCSQLSKELQPS